MSRIKLALAVLTALILLLACGPAEAQEKNLLGHPLVFGGFTTIGASGGRNYKLNIAGAAGGTLNTKRSQTFLAVGGNNSSKKQGPTTSLDVSLRSQYAVSKRSSIGGGASYGCLEGDDKIERCLITLEAFWCSGSFGEGVCIGPRATLNDSHDVVAGRLTWAKEFRPTHTVVVDIQLGVSRLQGVAGLPGYQEDGMSDDFAAIYRYGLFYRKSW